ncbi:hypothetical protein MYA_3892 [Burkholderia sp. KJ006]|nr:hypothetical protein MYA_3892 [Burkholderia sp. KJ006]
MRAGRREVASRQPSSAPLGHTSRYDAPGCATGRRAQR